MKRGDLLLIAGVVLFALGLVTFYALYGVGVSRLVFDGCLEEPGTLSFKADLDAPRLRVRVSGAAALTLVSAERGVAWEARLESGEYTVPLVKGRSTGLLSSLSLALA